MKRAFVNAVTFIVILATILTCNTGCARNEYHFGSWLSSYLPLLVPEMVQTCELTPDDMLMVDLTGSQFLDLARGQTCAGIRGLLNNYTDIYGFEPQSLMDNPALITNPRSLVGLQYAMIMVDGSTDASDWPNGLTQVLVDLVHHKLISQSTTGKYLSAYDPVDASLPALTLGAEDRFLTAVAPVATWGVPGLRLTQDR